MVLPQEPYKDLKVKRMCGSTARKFIRERVHLEFIGQYGPGVILLASAAWRMEDMHTCKHAQAQIFIYT